ncbi:bifunctional diguanylate cyclase/phosphodiesterase [Campylobacter fetus]|uniref:bifunctional diguanylate cyclase/phosphodiesterase n=1 Tax=Campylobacter fetus TaxID=196 RepID=UPI000AF5952D|nr:GGDEF domain-containing phosphodiesterase [Campylobacter fetus]
MNKRYITNKIIVVMVLVLSLFCAYFIFHTSEIISKNNFWLDKASEIKILNNDIDIQMSKQLSMINYDDMNAKITEINRLIHEIEMSKDFSKFFFKIKNKKIFMGLKKAIENKKIIIEKYQTLKSISSNDLVYISQNIQYASNLKFVSKLYSYIILSKLGTEFNATMFNHDINMQLNNIGDTKSFDYSLLSAIKDVGNSILALSNLSYDNINLKTTQKIDAFLNAINNHFKSNINDLMISVVVLLFIIILSSTRNIYTSVKNRKNAAKINQMGDMIANSPNQILIINREGKIIDANPAFEQISGYKKSEVLNKTLSFLNTNLKGTNIYDDILQSKQICRYNEFISKSKKGLLIYEKIIAIPTLDEYSQISGAIIVKQDITKERLIAKELGFKTAEIRNSALTDKLTGLGNHIALMEKIDDKKKGIVIYINVNHFSNLRFFYKTSTVDLILTAISETLKLCIETYKMNSSIYRIQLDEFCIWYEGSNINKDVKHILEYFKVKNIDIITSEGREILPNINITMGVSMEADTPNTNRLTQSILAHHEAISNDQNIAFYQDNNIIEQQYHKNQLISRMIQYALNENRVIVECQGIFDIRSSNKPILSSYEILIRIIDSENKIHYPGEFLGVAKQTSLYIALTKQVISKAFDLLETFCDKKFSINLSSIDMVNESVKKLFMQKLSLCSQPSHLTVEILESEGIDDYASINPFIESIKDHGCKLSIDDFGSGYSNYYRMLELDIDYLKIDGSIIKKLPFDENARSVVQTIVEFANRQKYDVVAEFVSSNEILEQVLSYGIKYAQDFLLGKPIHPSNID